MAKLTYTGFKGWSTLEQYNVYTGLATGVEKPNTPDQEEYVAPIESEDCVGPVEQEIEVAFYAHVEQVGARDWKVTLKDSAVWGEGSELAAPVDFSFGLTWKVDHGEAELVVKNETVTIPALESSASTTTPTIMDIIACLNTTVPGMTEGSYEVTYVYDPNATVCT